MKKNHFVALTLIALSATAQSQNASDYKISSNGFYENKGQLVDQNYQPNSAVKYLLCQPGINIQLRQTGFSYDTYTDEINKSLQKDNLFHFPKMGKDRMTQPETITRYYHRVDIELIRCNSAAPLIAEDSSEAYFNYFTSGTPNGGVSNVHYYQKITYKNIYPNIDLSFFTSPQDKSPVEYNFIVHPGGNAADIKLQYNGANKVSIVDNKLVVSVQAGDFTENIPSSYYANTKEQVQVNYTSLGNNVFTFFVPNVPNAGSDLIIDPTPCLTWGTYYGGSGGSAGGGDASSAITFDASNNVYITGYTVSTNAIATAGEYQTTTGGGYDAFIAKFNPSGSSLLWGTYYGGSLTDIAFAIALDVNDNVYITGNTFSTNAIATAGAYKATMANGGSNAFIAKFNSSGSSLLWGTYYGGNGAAFAFGIAIDVGDSVYIAGYTNSTDSIATTGAYQTTFGGGKLGNDDAFVAKFNPSGSSLLWGTYYGGSGSEEANAIAIDTNDNVYITGCTTSVDSIATPGAYQTAFGGGTNGGDAFIAKFNRSGSSLLWGTYYGGSKDDIARGIIVDVSNNVYITGQAISANGIATAGAYKETFGGGSKGNYDAFVAKFNPSGSSLLWGTYYGGNFGGAGYGIALDTSDNVYITGYTSCTDSIATTGAYQTTIGSSGDAFVAKFNPSGSSLLWGTYYGGSGSEVCYGMAIDASDNVYITGTTASTNAIATTGAYQKKFGGGSTDAFVAKFGCTDGIVGMPDINTSNDEIQFYPNPFNQLINIDNEVADGVTVIIYNILGKSMGNWIMDKGVHTINTSAYPSDVYVLEVKTKDGLLNKKLVKVN